MGFIPVTDTLSVAASHVVALRREDSSSHAFDLLDGRAYVTLEWTRGRHLWDFHNDAERSSRGQLATLLVQLADAGVPMLALSGDYHVAPAAIAAFELAGCYDTWWVQAHLTSGDEFVHVLTDPARGATRCDRSTGTPRLPPRCSREDAQARKAALEAATLSLL